MKQIKIAKNNLIKRMASVAIAMMIAATPATFAFADVADEGEANVSQPASEQVVDDQQKDQTQEEQADQDQQTEDTDDNQDQEAVQDAAEEVVTAAEENVVAAAEGEDLNAQAANTKTTVNVKMTLTGGSKTVIYNGEEQSFPDKDGSDANVFFNVAYTLEPATTGEDISAITGAFNKDWLGCKYTIEEKHAGTYTGNATAGDFYINTGMESYKNFAEAYKNATGKEVEFNITGCDIVQQPVFTIEKAKVYVSSPSKKAKYKKGKTLYTGTEITFSTNQEGGKLPYGEGYMVRKYTTLSKPGKVTNEVRITLGMESASRPGTFIDYDEFEYNSTGVKHYFGSDYQVIYDWGTLELTKANSGAAADTDDNDDAVTGDTVTITGDTDAHISDGNGGYKTTKLNGDETVPLKKLHKDGMGLFTWIIIALIVLAAGTVFFILWKRRKNNESDNYVQ